jgi:hypothetical protein
LRYVPETLSGEAKVEEKERHLDDEVHQDVVKFFDEQGLRYVRTSSSAIVLSSYGGEFRKPFRVECYYFVSMSERVREAARTAG